MPYKEPKGAVKLSKANCAVNGSDRCQDQITLPGIQALSAIIELLRSFPNWGQISFLKAVWVYLLQATYRSVFFALSFDSESSLGHALYRSRMEESPGREASAGKRDISAYLIKLRCKTRTQLSTRLVSGEQDGDPKNGNGAEAMEKGRKEPSNCAILQLTVSCE